MYTSLWKEPPQVSEVAVFAEFDWKYQIFLNINAEEWDLKIWLFNYWNDSVLSSAENYFLEICAYVPREGATAGAWESCFCWIWLKTLLFLKRKSQKLDLKILLFNYWTVLVLGSVQIDFLDVVVYVFLKGAPGDFWKGRFCFIWL